MHYSLAKTNWQTVGDNARVATMQANIGTVYKNSGQYDSSLNESTRSKLPGSYEGNT